MGNTREVGKQGERGLHPRAPAKVRTNLVADDNIKPRDSGLIVGRERRLGGAFEAEARMDAFRWREVRLLSRGKGQKVGSEGNALRGLCGF